MSETWVELEPEPQAVAERFGAAQPGLVAFAADLYEHGERLGLLGPREYVRLWSRHLLNCAAVAPVLKAGGTVADIGSGAGLPGLVLALVRPDVQFVLVEPMERRSIWLQEEAQRLELENVSVRRARSQELFGELRVDAVTGRAVSALKTLIGWTVPLLVPGGELVLMKGRSAAAEIEAASKAIRKHQLVDVRVELLGAEYLEEPTTVVRGTKQAEGDR